MATFSFYFVSAESLQSARVQPAMVKCCRLFWCYNRHGSTVVIHALFNVEQIFCFYETNKQVCGTNTRHTLTDVSGAFSMALTWIARTWGCLLPAVYLLQNMSPRRCATTNQTQSFSLGNRDAYARNGPAEPLHPNPFLRSPSIVLLRRLTV